MVYILHNQTCNCATVMLLTDFVGNRIGKLIVSGRLSCCYYQPLQQTHEIDTKLSTNPKTNSLKILKSE